MPGINDEAQGYDVNRITQALNGTNLLPITVGSLNIPAGNAVLLTLDNGDNSGTTANAQIAFGWRGSSPNIQYQHWIATEHNSGSASLNRIKFYTSDGTASGVFPTNAVLAMILEKGSATLTGDYSSVASQLRVSSKTASTKGGAVGWFDAGTEKWEVYKDSDQSLNLYDFTRAGIVLFLPPNGVPEWENTAVKFDNGINFGNGNTAVAAPNIHAGANDVSIEANAGIIHLRPAGTNSATNEVTVDGSGRLTFANATSQVIPGATSLSLRNNANNADNLILTDAGIGTMRNALKVPPSAGGTVATSNYGSVPVKIEEQTLSSSSGITIPASGSLPTGGRNLVIRWKIRSSAAATSDDMWLRFNGDSGATNYSTQFVDATSGTVSTSGSQDAQNHILAGRLTGNTSPANEFGIGKLVIFDYNDTSGQKHILSESFARETTGTTGMRWRSCGGVWLSTSAITSLVFSSGAGNGTFTGYCETWLEP